MTDLLCCYINDRKETAAIADHIAGARQFVDTEARAAKGAISEHLVSPCRRSGSIAVVEQLLERSLPLIMPASLGKSSFKLQADVED